MRKKSKTLLSPLNYNPCCGQLKTRGHYPSCPEQSKREVPQSQTGERRLAR